MDTMVIVLALIALLAPKISAADIVSCARAAGKNTTQCRITSAQAKQQADQLSQQASQQVAGKSAKQTADMMADVTSKISAIYQSAQDFCANSISSCVSECSDEEGAELAGACQTEMGKYVAQVTGGHGETHRGTEGGEISSFESKGNSGGGTGGTGSPASTQGPSGNSPTLTGNDATNPVFAGGLSKGGVVMDGLNGGSPPGSRNDSTNPAFPSADGGGGREPSSTGTTAGRGAAGNSGVAPTGTGRDGTASGTSETEMGFGVVHAIKQYRTKEMLQRMFSQGARTVAGPGAAATRAGGDREFAAWSARSASAGGTAAGRSPAGQAAASPIGRDVGSVYGPSIFLIHTRVIIQMCEEARLKCFEAKN
jgi:hypothetical protein